MQNLGPGAKILETVAHVHDLTGDGCSRPLAVGGRHDRCGAPRSPGGLLRSRNGVNMITRHGSNRLRTPETAVLATGVATAKGQKNVTYFQAWYLIYVGVII